MRTLFSAFVLTLFSWASHAQNGHVTIDQDSRIPELLKVYQKSQSNTGNYRIQVGFGTLAKAESIKASVEQDFPDLYSKIDFDSPTYRVRVGSFRTRLEAERKFLEIRQKYPEAMILSPKK